MQIFTELSTNIKKGGTYKLGPATLFVGQAGVGKSTMLQALHLAVAGTCAQTGKMPSEMAKLRAHGSKETRLYATARGGDGVMSWAQEVSVEGSGSRPKHAASGWCGALTETNRLAILAEDVAREASVLNRSDAKVRQTFLARFGSSMSLDDLAPPVGLLPNDQTLWESILTYCKTESYDIVEALTHFRSEIEARHKSAKAQVKTLQAGIEAQKTLISRPRQAERYEEFQKALVLLLQEEAIEACKVFKNAQKHVEALEKSSAPASITEAAVAKAEARVRDLIEGSASAARARDLFAKRARGENAPDCPYCASKLGQDRVEALAGLYAQRADDRSKALPEAEEALEQVRKAHESLLVKQVQLLESAKTEVLLAKSRFNRALTAAGMASREVEALADQVDRKAYTYVYTTVELTQMLADIDRSRGALGSLSDAREKLVAAEEYVQRMDNLMGELTVLEGRFAESAAARASAAVSRHMPIGRAWFDWSAFEWFVEIPKVTGPAPVVTACGTAVTMFKRAYALAWSEGAPFRVVTFDDPDLLGLTTEGVKSYFLALNEALKNGTIHQVVGAWNQDPPWLDSLGWTVHRLR